MRKILILGINGFVGHYLAKEFTNSGYAVLGSDIAVSGFDSFNGEYYQCDLCNYNNVKTILEISKPTHIVNLAAVSSVGLSWKMPQKTIEVNVCGTLNILEALKELSQTPRVLLVGSSEEYEVSSMPINEKFPLNANNPYGISKLMQDNFSQIYIEHYGMKIYRVRPFNHTGIGQNKSFVLPDLCKQVAEIEKSAKPGNIKVGNLSAKRDFSDVRDIVKAYRLIIESDLSDMVFNVGSGLSYSLQELLEYIISLSNQNISIEVDQERFRPIDTPIICCDNSLIKKTLNWKPVYTIFETLKDMYMFYNKEVMK